MTSGEETPTEPVRRIAPVTWAALILAVASAGVLQLSNPASPPGTAAAVAMTLAVLALVIGGFGVANQPRNRIGLILAALTALLAAAGVYPGWDSVRLLPLVMTGVAVAAAAILSLPRAWQRAVVSLLAVYHFLGVASAITSPPPQSWLSHWAWVTVFRPHLVFCYTNNAYQFYSPEPGPASLLWFCVELKDGDKAWVKLPRKPETHLDPMAVQAFRRLSITEAANQNYGLTVPPTDAQNRRLLRTDIPILDVNEVPLGSQYRMPQELTRQWVSSFARHVALQFGGKDKVNGIKIYRVTHQMLTPQQFAEGRDPFGKTTYWPYYLGEYHADGTLTDPNDPMLFWLVPIVARNLPVGPGTRPGGMPVEVTNYLARHAGSDPFAVR